MSPRLFKIRLHCFLTEKIQIWEKHLVLPKTSVTSVMQCQLGQMGPVQSTPLPPPPSPGVSLPAH